MKKKGIKRTSSLTWIIFAILLLDALLMIALYAWSFFTSVKSTEDFLKEMLLPTLPWKWDF